MLIPNPWIYYYYLSSYGWRFIFIFILLFFITMQYNYFKTECVREDLTRHYNKVWEIVVWEATFIINCYWIHFSFTVMAYDDWDDKWTDWYIDLHWHFIKDFQVDWNVFENWKLEDFVNKCNSYLYKNDWFILVIASMLRGHN